MGWELEFIAKEFRKQQMKHFKYLIVGGGLAGDGAVRGIRELDPNGSIGMFSMELDPPYTRPYLSKNLWKGTPLEKVWKKTDSLGVEMLLNHKVTGLDLTKKSIRDEAGEDYSYEKLLLATGGFPSQLPFGSQDDIIYYRTMHDYERLRAVSERWERFLVIGGGFIGSELAAALTMNGKKVVMVFPEETIGAHVYPGELAHFLNDYYREKGVDVMVQDTVTGLQKNGDHFTVRTRNGLDFEVDGVVAGIGIRPDLQLAQQAGLALDNGIIVDNHLQTSAPDVYAAGDVANFQHVALGKRVRVEHEDNAVQMGKQAGRNMAGAGEAYTHIPMFYSDLFELGYEAVGEINSKLEVIADWQEPFKKGVIYYLENQRVRGVLLWNVWEQVDNARALLKETGPFMAKDLKGRIPLQELQDEHS
jgi:NADPH-dependent 2,4-dienoyl-CoA reductase/sulfur reductase-like enzyme